MIEYYYIYLINKKFSLETKNIYIFSVLEDGLSTKCITFSFPLKFNDKQKKTAREGDKNPGSSINIKKLLKRN